MFRRFPVEASTLIGVFDPAIDQPITVEDLTRLPESVPDVLLSRSFVTA